MSNSWAALIQQPVVSDNQQKQPARPCMKVKPLSLTQKITGNTQMIRSAARVSNVQCHLAHGLGQSGLQSSQLCPWQMHEACEVLLLDVGLLQAALRAIWKQRLCPRGLQRSAQLLWQRCGTALLAHSINCWGQTDQSQLFVNSTCRL